MRAKARSQLLAQADTTWPNGRQRRREVRSYTPVTGTGVHFPSSVYLFRIGAVGLRCKPFSGCNKGRESRGGGVLRVF